LLTATEIPLRRPSESLPRSEAYSPGRRRGCVRANIILLIAFENDLPAVFETAEEIGLLDASNVWLDHR